MTTTPGGRLELGLGDRVTWRGRRRVAWPVLVPATAGLGQPDAVYVNEAVPSGGRVDLVYRARLPPSPFTDVDLLITEFQGQHPEFLKKVTVMGVVERVTVGGEPGYWFSGEPHFFTYRDAAGTLRESRPAWPATPDLATRAT